MPASALQCVVALAVVVGALGQMPVTPEPVLDGPMAEFTASVSDDLSSVFRTIAQSVLATYDVESALRNATTADAEWEANRNQTSARSPFLQMLDLVGALSQEIRSSFSEKAARTDFLVDAAQTLVAAQAGIPTAPEYYSCEIMERWPPNLYDDDTFNSRISMESACIKANPATQKKIDDGSDPRVNADVKILMDLVDTYKINHVSSANMFWSYVGTTETGILSNWPGTTPWNEDYDPRWRPWYAEAATGPKDLIILLDSSGSMRTGHRFENAKTAVDTILKTLTKKDFVSIIAFGGNEDIENHAQAILDCASDRLIPASADAIDKFLVALDEVEPDGATDFAGAFEVSMKLFESSLSQNRTSGCQRIVLFLTDGISNDPLPVIQQYEDLGVRVFSYTIGDQTDSAASVSIGCGTNGATGHVRDDGDATAVMVRYASLIGQGSARWSAPYIISGNFQPELMVSRVAPIRKPNGDLWGVAAVDVQLSNIVNLVEGFFDGANRFPGAYAFLVSGDGTAYVHPRTTSFSDPPSQDIAELEMWQGAPARFETDVRPLFTERLFGWITIDMPRINPLGKEDREGVDVIWESVTYITSPVAGTDFVVGVRVPTEVVDPYGIEGSSSTAAASQQLLELVSASPLSSSTVEDVLWLRAMDMYQETPQTRSWWTTAGADSLTVVPEWIGTGSLATASPPEGETSYPSVKAVPELIAWMVSPQSLCRPDDYLGRGNLDYTFALPDLLELHNALNNETVAPVPTQPCIKLSSSSTYEGPSTKVTGNWTGASLKQAVRPTMRLLNNKLRTTFRTKGGFVDGAVPSTLSDAIWLYYATQSGLTAMWPAASSTAPKNFDPTLRPWYARAAALWKEQTVAISSPYWDTGGAGYVVTMSQAATTTGGLSDPSAKRYLHGVSAVDFPFGVINSRVKSSFDATFASLPASSKSLKNGCGREYPCVQSPNGICETRCFVVDTASFVIYADAKHRLPLAPFEPLGRAEGALVASLVDSGILLRDSFSDVSSGCIVPCTKATATAAPPDVTEESAATRLQPFGFHAFREDAAAESGAFSSAQFEHRTSKRQTSDNPPAKECRADCSQTVSVLLFNDRALHANSSAAVTAALGNAPRRERVRAYFSSSSSATVLELSYRTPCGLGTAYASAIAGTNAYAVLVADYWRSGDQVYIGNTGQSLPCPEEVPTAVRNRDECGVRPARPIARNGCIAAPSDICVREGCENDCNQNGDCSNGKCICDVGYSETPDCSVAGRKLAQTGPILLFFVLLGIFVGNSAI